MEFVLILRKIKKIQIPISIEDDRFETWNLFRRKTKNKMLFDKSAIPSEEELLDYCGDNKARFDELKRLRTEQVATGKSVGFPYGNKNSWCVSHRKKKKLI